MLSLSISLLLFSCKKEEKKEELDYNKINQERLMGNWVVDSVLYGADSTARFPDRYKNSPCDSLKQAEVKLLFRFSEETVIYDECSNFGTPSSYKDEYTIWEVKNDSIRIGKFSQLYTSYHFQIKNDSSLILTQQVNQEESHYHCSKLTL